MLALYGWEMKPFMWLRYVDDTSTILKHGVEGLQCFLDYFNSFRRAIKFTMEVEMNCSLPFFGRFGNDEGWFFIYYSLQKAYPYWLLPSL
jgi:hypothetical protein